MEQIRLTIDVIAKYVVLFAFTFFIWKYINVLQATGRELNLPDFIVALFVLVFQYFFRRSPKETTKGEKNV